MRPETKSLNRRLTLRQVALVLLALLLVAMGNWAACQWIAARLLAARVEAALPKICAQLRADRHVLVTAINAYKAHFGSCPPDHLLGKSPLSVDPITNTLIYELFGTIHNPDLHTYTPQGLEEADEQEVRRYFQCDRFKNCGERLGQIIRFLGPLPLLVRKVQKGPDIFLPGSHIPDEGYAPGVFTQIQISSWRYVCSAPTNNPLQFDLWVELKTGTKTQTLGNWQAVD